MLNSPGFLRHKWPKHHAYVVEQCEALHVSEVLPYLHPLNHALIETWWSPPTHPSLRLVPRRGGPFKKWYFACPRCWRPYETLYVPPGGRPEDWRCRVCWDLIYASQRYGVRHPLHKRLTHRKKITRRKEAMRQARRWARRDAKQRRFSEAARSRDKPVLDNVLDGLRRLLADTNATDTPLVITVR